MTELNKSYNFVFLFDVKNGNPNGDPDAGNAPRTISSGKGLVTDVCIKGKIRNYVLEHKGDESPHCIYVQKGTALNDQHRKAYEANNIKPSATKPKIEDADVTGFMCQNFFDVRAFGAVMSLKVNCGQVLGPVQLTMSESIDRIQPDELGITRKARADDDGHETEMGSKHMVPYALYRGHGFVSANQANKTGFSAEDLELLWKSFGGMFELDRSASRGEMALRKLIVFEHDDPLFNAPAHQLFDRIEIKMVSEQPAQSYSDYEVQIDDSNLPEGVRIIYPLG